LCYFLGLLTLGCSNDDDGCSPLTYEIKNLENVYFCVDTQNGVDIDLSEEYIIIRSQFEFDNRVTGTCTPQIDFEIYDLLIGKRQLNKKVTEVVYDQLGEDCENGQLTLVVTFRFNDTDENTNLTYHTLVPKLETNETVIVTIYELSIFNN
jgi:hypothetical protein